MAAALLADNYCAGANDRQNPGNVVVNRLFEASFCNKNEADTKSNYNCLSGT